MNVLVNVLVFVIVFVFVVVFVFVNVFVFANVIDFQFESLQAHEFQGCLFLYRFSIGGLDALSLRGAVLRDRISTWKLLFLDQHLQFYIYFLHSPCAAKFHS